MAVSTTCHMDLATSRDLVLCCDLKCRFILVGLIVIKVFPTKAGWFNDFVRPSSW